MPGMDRDRAWCRSCGSEAQREPHGARHWLCFGCGVRDRFPDTDRLFVGDIWAGLDR